jgi:hypothetical protein
MKKGGSMKKKQVNNIPLFDLNASAYQHLNVNSPELALNGTRVTFMFKADETFFRLSEQYNSNISVNVLDFVNAQRQLRAMMMALKGGQR